MQLMPMRLVVLLLLAVFVAEGKPPTTTKPLDQPVLDLTGSSADKYAIFMSKIERLLIGTTTTPAIKNRRAVLGVQKRNPPCFHAIIRGDNNQWCNLTVRTDNVYLVVFGTPGGSSYAFKFDERFVDGSTSLGFKGDYNSLVRGHKNLANVDLGKTAAQEAVATLASYTSSTSEKELKKALTRLIVMVCEATRFAPIRAAVKAAWEDGGKLPPVGVSLVVLWKDTSCALLVWNRDQSTEWSTIKEVVGKNLENNGDPLMKSADAALDNVYLLLRPSEKCSDDKTAALSVDY